MRHLHAIDLSLRTSLKSTRRRTPATNYAYVAYASVNNNTWALPHGKNGKTNLKKKEKLKENTHTNEKYRGKWQAFPTFPLRQRAIKAQVNRVETERKLKEILETKLGENYIYNFRLKSCCNSSSSSRRLIVARGWHSGGWQGAVSIVTIATAQLFCCRAISVTTLALFYYFHFHFYIFVGKYAFVPYFFFAVAAVALHIEKNIWVRAHKENELVK